MAPSTGRAARSRPAWLFRGWLVVAGVFCLMAIAAGLGFYNASVYVEVLVAERGVPVAIASAGSATFFVAFGLVGLPVSRWIAERDPRPVMLGGAVVGGLALLWLGAASGTWEIFGVFGLLGVAFCGISFVPGTLLVNRWFERHRALALTLATTGLSVGGIAITPASAGAIERADLAAVTPWLALIWTLGASLVVLVAIRPWPRALGLAPDGAPPGADRGATPESEAVAVGTLSPAQVYRSATFRWLTGGVTLLMLSQVGAMAHLYGIGVTRVDHATASLAVSTVATSSVVGRFAGIWVLRHLDALHFMVLLAGLQIGSMAVLAVDAGRPGLLLATSVFGLSVGNLLILVPVVLVESFGIAPYARIYAMNQFLGALGVAAGPVLFGGMRDLFGDYTAGAAAACGASLLATSLLVGAVRARRRELPDAGSEPRDRLEAGDGRPRPPTGGDPRGR